MFRCLRNLRTVLLILIMAPVVHAGQIIAHRGAPYLVPENTIESIRRAYDLGADIVEVDVRLSSDQKAVLMHDSSLSRTTGVQAEVWQKSFAELRGYDAGYWSTWRGRGLKIPALEEALVVARDYGRQIMLDCKIPGLIPQIRAAVQSTGIPTEHVSLLSYYWDQYTYYGTGLPEHHLTVLAGNSYGDATQAQWQRMRRQGIDGITAVPITSYNPDALDIPSLRMWQAEGFTISVIYAKPTAAFYWMDAGADSFWTDDIAGTVRLYRQMSAQWNNWADRWQMPSGQRATRFDPDGDGRSNLEEYATGTNPTRSDQSQALQPVKGAAGLEWTLDVSENWSQFLKLTAQAGDRTGTWRDLPQSCCTLVSPSRVKFRLPENDPAQLLRVKFELPSE